MDVHTSGGHTITAQCSCSFVRWSFEVQASEWFTAMSSMLQPGDLGGCLTTLTPTSLNIPLIYLQLPVSSTLEKSLGQLWAGREP